MQPSMPRMGDESHTEWARRQSSTLSLMEVLYGLHPVEEALKAGKRRFDHVLVARDRLDDRIERLINLCRKAGVPVRPESREKLTAMAKTEGHQGVVAMVRPQEILTLEDLFEPLASTPGAARLL